MKKEQIVAWIGMDWADEAHEVCDYSVETGRKANYAVNHGAEALQEWVSPLRARYGGETGCRRVGTSPGRFDRCADEQGF